jgi:hypothetical protein
MLLLETFDIIAAPEVSQGTNTDLTSCEMRESQSFGECRLIAPPCVVANGL